MRRQWFILFVVIAILASSLGTIAPAARAQVVYVNYVVQPGDTLGKIALDYCTTWQSIYELNQDAIGPDPNTIKSGTVLVIPANCIGGTTPPPAGTVYDRGPMTHATGFYSAPYYTVAWGDTLNGIGMRFGVAWQDIAAVNGLTGTTVYAGQVLYIPGATATVPPPTQGPVERVYFATGATSGAVTGVIYGGIPMNYILWARAGQVMSISTISHAEPLVISVGNASGDLLPLSGTNSQVYNTVSAVLPQDGDYLVTVRPATTPESPELVFDITFIIQ